MRTRLSSRSQLLKAPLFLFLLLLLPIAVKAEPKAFDYLVPEADTRVYGINEFKIMPRQVLTYAKNEIYARHGRKFNSPELQGYFNEQPWYNGTIEPSAFSESIMNDFERANVMTLAELEERSAPYGYQLDDPYRDIDYSVVYDYMSSLYGFHILKNLEMYGTAATTIVESDYFTLFVPNYGTWDLEAYDSRTFRLYHVPSRNSGYEGGIVSIRAYDLNDDSYMELPNWALCGESSDKRYVAIFPTDIRFDPNKKEEADEYSQFSEWAQALDMNAHPYDNPFTPKGSSIETKKDEEVAVG